LQDSVLSSVYFEAEGFSTWPRDSFFISMSPAEKCPVDHSSVTSSTDECPVDHKARSSWSDLLPKRGQPSRPAVAANSSALSSERQTSSIPKAADGNWVYPSEAQFFTAMARKNHNPQASDMKTIVPIHNAVNERAWVEVMKWEAGRGGEKCGGVKLVNFKGKPGQRSWKATWKTLLGYIFSRSPTYFDSLVGCAGIHLHLIATTGSWTDAVHVCDILSTSTQVIAQGHPRITYLSSWTFDLRMITGKV
jgi:hypothetical protein